MVTKGKLTRQNIIEKSIQLFSVKGYFHTSIADILEAAGITRGGLYGHFRSKEEIWYAAYEECTRVWKNIVFNGIGEISDPLERIQRIIENSMRDYLGGGVFEGGCFLFNSLVEFSRQSSAMNRHILQGFKGFRNLLRSWLQEAEKHGMLQDGLVLDEVANFIVISLNGAGPLYSSSGDPAVWKQTISQLHFYLRQLRKQA
ncbi:MAG: TetR/AcrR family transcriptional regulator [Syntrophobacteraceae bacterium]|nr:TetR/AcrR family transcriptional regulator [Syntrophobacteraceae bacterium]